MKKGFDMWCNKSDLRDNICKTSGLMEVYQWNCKRSPFPVFVQSEEANQNDFILYWDPKYSTCQTTLMCPQEEVIHAALLPVSSECTTENYKSGEYIIEYSDRGGLFTPVHFRGPLFLLPLHRLIKR